MAGAANRRVLLTGRMAEEIGAPAQVSYKLRVACIALQPTKRDQAADVDRNASAVHAHELSGKQRRSQPRMEEPGRLEPRAVLPSKKYRQDRRPGMTDDAADGGAPGRVGHLEAGQPHVGDLAGRENEQHAAVLEPAQGVPHGADVDADRAAAAEGVDRDGQVPQLGNTVQQTIRHDFHIRPATQENVRHDDAFNAAEGVVADDDRRTFPGDALEILRFDEGLHVQAAQDFAHEKMGVALEPYLFIQGLALLQAEQLFDRTGHGG